MGPLPTAAAPTLPKRRHTLPQKIQKSLQIIGPGHPRGQVSIRGELPTNGGPPRVHFIKNLVRLTGRAQGLPLCPLIGLARPYYALDWATRRLPAPTSLVGLTWPSRSEISRWRMGWAPAVPWEGGRARRKGGEREAGRAARPLGRTPGQEARVDSHGTAYGTTTGTPLRRWGAAEKLEGTCILEYHHSMGAHRPCPTVPGPGPGPGPPRPSTPRGAARPCGP